jgi:hypothetical protein
MFKVRFKRQTCYGSLSKGREFAVGRPLWELRYHIANSGELKAGIGLYGSKAELHLLLGNSQNYFQGNRCFLEFCRCCQGKYQHLAIAEEAQASTHADLLRRETGFNSKVYGLSLPAFCAAIKGGGAL